MSQFSEVLTALSEAILLVICSHFIGLCTTVLMLYNMLEIHSNSASLSKEIVKPVHVKKSAYKPSGPSHQSLSCFCSMKQQEIFSTRP